MSQSSLYSLENNQRQRWSIIGGFQAAMDSREAKTELKGWTALALLSLGLAGIFALLLAISRVPNVESVFPWPLQFFQKGLVIHVVFSFVVWFLSLLAGLLTIATYRLSDGAPRVHSLGRISIILGLVAFVLLFLPALMDRGEASLNNYVPVIIDPLYYTGLIFFAASIALQFIRFLINIPNHSGAFDPVSQGIAVSGILYFVALICFGISLALRWETPVDGAFNEDVFWAGGHVLQYINTLLMLLSWYILFFCFLYPVMGAPTKRTRSLTILIWSYAVGQTFHSLGLFLAGGYGAPRKTAGADQGIEALGAQVGLYIMGVGALVAVIGGTMFIWIATRMLRQIK
jgi:hypothetical protein